MELDDLGLGLIRGRPHVGVRFSVGCQPREDQRVGPAEDLAHQGLQVRAVQRNLLTR